MDGAVSHYKPYDAMGCALLLAVAVGFWVAVLLAAFRVSG